MAHKEFGAARREAVGDPITFSLGGETFTCLDRLPAVALLDLADAPERTRMQTIAASRRFITDVLAPGDEVRFEKVLASKDNPVDVDDLTEILGWLVEVYTGRPTVRPSSSPPGSSSGGQTSRVDTSSPEPEKVS